MTTTPATPPELLVFLREVRERAEDDLPLLVLADWLQDRGDPRGELIHVQVMRARLGPGEPAWDALGLRARELLRRHALDWLGPLADHAAGWQFERGLVQLDVRAERFLRPDMEALAGSAWGLWVNELTIEGVTGDQVPQLARSAWLPQLTALRLPDCRLGPRGVAALFSFPDLPCLRVLDLGGNGLSEGARAKLSQRFGAAFQG
jgi:uncharacterized protein (TIGR02996 family)